MSVLPSGLSVRDNPAESRYEIYEGEQLAGFTTYTLGDDRISFLHTEVANEFSGRGLARQLVTEELEDARRRELAVLPYCPYVQKIIAQSSDAYLDLVPDKDRDRFGLPRSKSGTPGSGAQPVGE